MRSPSDHEGFRLLNKWKTKPALISISFSGILNSLSLSATGFISDFDSEVLRFKGTDFDMSFNLKDAIFSSVWSEQVFEDNDLEHSKYGFIETAEISLDSGEKISLKSLPRKEDRPN